MLKRLSELDNEIIKAAKPPTTAAGFLLPAVRITIAATLRLNVVTKLDLIHSLEVKK